MMAEPEFSPEMRKALDSYAVPPLPGGFADRLMARIEAGDTASAPAPGFANRLRRGGASGRSAWRRSGRIMGSVAFLSLATATAAAAGVFGNPVYVPVVSEVLDRTELVAKAKFSAPVKPVAFKAPPVNADTVAVSPEIGTKAVVSRIEKMRTDPTFSKLPPRERLAAAGKEIRNMVRSGEATREEARAAVREVIRATDPETKAKWRENAIARREARLKRRMQTASSAEVGPVPTEKLDPDPVNGEPGMN